VDAKDILKDAFGRLPDLVRDAVQDLTPEQLRWAPAETANPIGWLVWHLTRIQDHHIADLMDTKQVYVSEGWAEKFGLKSDPSDTGYDHVPAEVAAVHAESWQVLVDYYTAVHERTVAYLDGLTDANLDDIVDERWDPPVTRGVRLVSVLDDDSQHVGQAAYVRGLLQR
jgi:uncharacterized damage-inducible protein DinB